VKYQYFPGCSLESSSKSYDHSTREVAKALGIELVELEDWNCCGATSYLAVEEFMALAITARNLCLAEKTGDHELVAPCSGCYTILSKINHYIEEKPDFKDRLNQALAAANLQYQGGVKVRHILEVLAKDVGLWAITNRVKHPLKDLKVACYSGCQISRPLGVFDDPECPMVLDNLMEAIGAEPVYFPMKSDCCGGMLMSTREEAALELCHKLLLCAERNRADVIVTACPLCQMNLEGYQDQVNARFGTRFNIPVLFFTQLVGLALGISQDKLGIPIQLIRPDKALAAIG